VRHGQRNRHSVTVTTGGGNFVPANGFNQTNAIRVSDPFKGGGSVPAMNIDMAGNTCPAHVKNRTNWYNPCAFIDPFPGADIPVGTVLTDLTSALAYSGSKANQIHGPDMSGSTCQVSRTSKPGATSTSSSVPTPSTCFNTPSLGQPNPGGTDLGFRRQRDHQRTGFPELHA